MRSLPNTAVDVQSIPAGRSGAVPRPPNPHSGSRRPPETLTLWHQEWVGTQTGTFSVTPWFTSCGDPKICQLCSRTVGGVTPGQYKPLRTGATCDPGAGVGLGGSCLSHWGLCAAPSDSPLQQSLPRRQQLQERQLLASPNRLGLLPSSFSISGQTEKTLLEFTASLLLVCKTGGLETRRDPPAFPRVSTFEPEPRLLSIALVWNTAGRLTALFGTDFASPLALHETRGKELR